MFIVLSLLMLGMGIGCVLRRFRCSADTSRSVSITIAALIFIFGTGVGSNKAILDNISNIGVPALVISILGISGSLVAAYGYDRFFGKKGGEK